MEQDKKREKFREQRNPEKNMAKNVCTRSSSFGTVASSRKDSDSVSTSPILDTGKIRRKGKLWTARRAVSDSAFSPGLGKFSKGQGIKPFSSMTEETSELDRNSCDKALKKCKCCDSLLKIDNQCQNCFTHETNDQKSDSLDKNLANRLRYLKSLKKPTARISDFKDEQITDEQFVQSVRILDKVCDSTSPTKMPQNLGNRLGLIPFLELERLRLSQLPNERNSSPEFDKGTKACDANSPTKMPQNRENRLEFEPFVDLERLRLSQMKEHRNSLPVIHLSLDEDKEEDGDMFADKEGAEVAENLEEFTPWGYKFAETSPSPFHGFSSQEYKNSSQIAEKNTQVLKSEEIDGFFFGFSHVDIKLSEDSLKNLNTESSKRQREDFSDNRDDEEAFSSTFKSKITRISDDVKKERFSEINSTENVFFNDNLKRKRAESLSKNEDRCKKSKKNNAELENEDFSANCEKKEETCQSIAKTKVLPFPRIKYMKERAKNESQEFLNSQINRGFSTAAGRPIKLSETAIAKAKFLLAQEIESIDDDIMDNFEFDCGVDSASKCGILDAEKFSISVSTTNKGKTEEKYEVKGEIKTEAPVIKTEAFSQTESIEDDLFEETENIKDSGNKLEFMKTKENVKIQKDELFDKTLDTATVSRISCGFSTAAGRPIRVSKTALEKAESRLANEVEIIEDELFVETDDIMDSESKSGLIKVEEKNDMLLDHELDVVTESRSSSGFSTAGGIPISISKTALEKAEALLSKEVENLENELFDELDIATESGSKCPAETEISNSRTSSKEILKKSPKKITKSSENDSKINFGFSTAGGRELKVSERSWSKSKAVFDTIEVPPVAELPETKTKPESPMEKDSKINFGFSTAGGRELKVSEKSWSKSKAVFDTIEVPPVAELPETKTKSESPIKKDSKINFGFSTAGGRELKVSEKSWSKSKAIFDTIEVPPVAEFPETKTKSESPMKKDDKINFGFSTARGQELKVSEKSWSKSKAVFDTIEVPPVAELPETKTNPESPSKKDGKINFGFSTAGGRELKVSEKSWSKSKAIFDTIEVPPVAELPETKTKPESPMKNDGKINFGFSTAGGRELKVSEKSWSKSKAIFDTIEVPPVAELPETKTKPESPMEKDSKINFGFSTAGGQELKVSEKSWSKSKAVFDTIEVPPVAELPETKTNPESPSKKDGKINFGFSTAGGRELKVSEKSWSKSKAVFDTIEVPSVAELPETKTKSESPIKKDGKINFGFSTAGGRELKVSEKSWSKSKAIFDTIEVPSDAELPETKTKPESPMKKDSKINFGFSTAGGRELKVSEKSWSKSKAVFDSIDESSLSEFSKTKTPDPKIHSSSSRTKINVPNEAQESQMSSDLDNIESLEFDYFIDPVEETEASKKRKLEEIDDDTPLRRESSLKRKRGRYVNDLQARKLFMEDSNREDEAETTKKSSEKNLISEEVDASAAALLEDEERSNEGTTWQINDLRSGGSVSPELGSEMANRSRVDVSTKNSFAIFNRAEMEKVNATEGKEKSSSSRAASSSGSIAETQENNHGAASAEKREEIQHESIPDDLTFDSQFSQDIQRSPVIDKFIADTMKIMEGRLTAALKQDEAIRGKRRMKIEQSDGFLFRLRNDNKETRISWDELTEGIPPSPREIAKDSSGRDVVTVNADEAVNYSFRCADFYGEMEVRRNIEGVKVGDGAFLVLDEKNCAGAREFERAFLASPGVDPNLVPTGWVKNHYRWIVWKLASMDRVKFGHKCLPRMLTPERVMLELKYRYDREIYRIQWPPLRRILERGEDASARLVLCVSSIIEENCVNPPVKGAHTPNSMGSTMYRMKVTDGWYSISTSIDTAMNNLIKSGKVREGTKLMTFGAKAVNLDQGCSVLEIPEAVSLRIYSNSTRRAKWNTKLDFCRFNRGPMSLSLKSVKPNGGAICKLVVAVSRVYPILYREKLPDGQFVFRNARCDEEAARAHEARYQAKMEEIYANAWSEFQIASMNKKGIGAAKSRSYTQEEAAACGRDMEEELRQKISSKMSECLPTPRDVTPVIKMRIADEDTCALVTVWSTDRDTTELFVEGSSIAIYNAFASGLRASELQITAGRSTFVKREISRRISYPERIYTSLSHVTESGFHPVYGEFDTIGIVSSTGPAPHGMKNFETVNLACPKPGEADASDFLSVLFWQGVLAHGYAKILTVGSLVACSNLEWRRNTSRSIPTAYCTERSVFSKNPRQNHLIQPFESLRNEIKEPQAYAASCAALIEEEIVKKSALRTPGNCGTPYRPATSNNRTPGWSPRDLSIDSSCTTPTIESRKNSTRKRLEKLDVYGEPPKLPSIVINNSSRKVSSDFRSPVLTPVTKS